MSMFPAIVVLATCLGQRDPDAKVIFRDGPIVVKEERPFGNLNAAPRRALFIDRVYFGNGNGYQPDDAPEARRKPTTYYHARGPIGHLFHSVDPFRNSPSPFRSDARMPTHLVATGWSFGGMPGLLAAAWSEPPIAVVGMHSGTLASYGKPFQGIDFVERNPAIVGLSLPKKRALSTELPIFFNIHDAQNRGSVIRVFRGDARAFFEKDAPKGYYKYVFVEMCQRIYLEDIETELITKEGMQSVLATLAPDGVACFHTSNRYLDLPPVVANSAKALGALSRTANDDGDRGRFEKPGNNADPDHFGSQWVLVSRDADVLRKLTSKVDSPKTVRWVTSDLDYKQVWTDKGPNPLKGILRGGDPDVWHAFDRTLDALEAIVPQRYLNEYRVYERLRSVFDVRAKLFQAAVEARDENSSWLRKTK